MVFLYEAIIRNKFGKYKKKKQEEREMCIMMDQTVSLLSVLFLAVHFSLSLVLKKKKSSVSALTIQGFPLSFHNHFVHNFY